MLEFYIKGQNLTFYSPVIAADSLNFLTAQFNFAGEDWQGADIWAHFAQGDTVYDIELENGRIDESKKLNLTAGLWQVYVTGTRNEQRLTTVPVFIRVKESGLRDAPLHELPLSAAEQIAAKADSAVRTAESVKAAADRGDFTGQSFQVLGYFDTLSALTAAVTEPGPGSVYGVGAAPPYDIYIWDGINECWKNNGPVQGPKGDSGSDGVSFIPSVSPEGNLSWTNDGGLQNPETVNLTGPRGQQGDAGSDGESPFEAAVREGYTGTAATFYASLAALAQHGQQHKSGGTDPLPEKSVDASMLCANSVSGEYSLLLKSSDWQQQGDIYVQALSVPGLSESDRLIADIDTGSAPASELQALSDIWGDVLRAAKTEAGLEFSFAAKPERDISVKILAVRK